MQPLLRILRRLWRAPRRLLTPESFTITNSAGKTATITTGAGVNTLTDLENAVNKCQARGYGEHHHGCLWRQAGDYKQYVRQRWKLHGDFHRHNIRLWHRRHRQERLSCRERIQHFKRDQYGDRGSTGPDPEPLERKSKGTSASLTVAPDTSAATTAINKFVTDYNTAITDLNSEFANVSGSGQGSLAQDPAVQNLQSVLEQAVAYTAAPASGNATTTAPTLTSLGISVGSDGTLSVNNTTLSNALQNNFGDVQNFFQGAALNGFAAVLNTQLTSFTSPADGAFTVDLQSIKTETTGLQTNITNFEANVIAPLQTKMQSDFSQAEILLQQLPQQIKTNQHRTGQ